MKAESMQLFMIPVTQNYKCLCSAPKCGDASHLSNKKWHAVVDIIPLNA